MLVENIYKKNILISSATVTKPRVLAKYTHNNTILYIYNYTHSTGGRKRQHKHTHTHTKKKDKIE